MSEPADSAALRQELRAIVERRKRGDLRERQAEKLLAERTVDLYRATVRSRLGAGETVIAEHHAVLGHLRLSQSVLHEPEQDATSLFLTSRRLLRIRARLLPGRAPSCDEADETQIEAVERSAVRRVEIRRERRTGEAAVGAGIVVVAMVLSPLLSFTGPILLGLGVLGIAHALLMPTRTALIVIDGWQGEPFVVLATRAKSARRLLAAVREIVEEGRGHRA